MSELKDAQDKLEAEKERLVNEHLASAVVRDVLAPLERAVEVLKPQKAEESKDELGEKSEES